jgi:DNA (cytosine-5)-methyltransferase 1
VKPRLLDLFCGAGGAAMGYHRAGFEVVGVDINAQPHYPFEFVQADALNFTDRLIAYERQGIQWWGEFDAIHASPPCQAYSWSAKRWDRERADLMAPTRDRLQASGLPYVIENVIGAPLIDPLTLCGTQFGLEVIRHRLFESSVLLLGPGSRCRHAGSVKAGDYVTVAGHGGDNVKGRGSRAAKQRAMGIDWMTDDELNEAIPPAYTEWLGAQLMAVIERQAVSA